MDMMDGQCAPRMGMEAGGAWSCRSVTRKGEAHGGISECLSATQHVKRREGPGEERACKEGVRSPASERVSQRGRLVRCDWDRAVRAVWIDDDEAGDEGERGFGLDEDTTRAEGDARAGGGTGLKGRRGRGIKGDPKGTTRGRFCHVPVR